MILWNYCPTLLEFGMAATYGICSLCICLVYLIKNIPGVKKGRPRTKTGLAEKDVKSNGWPMPSGFDRFESFGHDELTEKHCYFRC